MTAPHYPRDEFFKYREGLRKGVANGIPVTDDKRRELFRRFDVLVREHDAEPLTYVVGDLRMFKSPLGISREELELEFGAPEAAGASEPRREGLVHLLRRTRPAGVALVASAYLGHTRFEQLLLGLLLIVATAAASAIWRQRRWERPVAGRLASWRAFDPSRGEVQVAVYEGDADAACLAIRRARLYPKWIRARVEVRPDGILRTRDIGVVQPLAVSPVEFEGVARRTRAAVECARIPARVAGVDVGSPLQPRERGTPDPTFLAPRI